MASENNGHGPRGLTKFVVRVRMLSRLRWLFELRASPLAPNVERVRTAASVMFDHWCLVRVRLRSIPDDHV